MINSTADSSAPSKCKLCGKPIDHVGICNSCDAELRYTEEQRTIADAVESLNLPKLFRGATWENWKPVPEVTDAVARLQAWSGDPWCVVLVGPAGAGKSHAAAATLRAWLVAGRTPGRWVQAADWIAACQGSESAAAAERQYRNVANVPGLLVLDDVLLREHPTEYVLDLWDRLVNARYSAGLPTLLTTNHTRHEIRQRLGERVLDRIDDGVILWAAPSYRRKRSVERRGE